MNGEKASEPAQYPEASEEVAEYDRRMYDIERKLTRLEALQWITSAGVIAILVRVYWP